MRLIHDADCTSVENWLKRTRDKAKREEIMTTLPDLSRGEAWVWSPEAGFGPVRVQFPMFETFDSFAAQQLQKKVSGKGWATVDLDEVKSKLAAVIEKRKAEDPKELTRQIGELRKEVADLKKKGACNHGEELKSLHQDLRQARGVITNLRNAIGAAMKFIVNLDAKGFFDVKSGKVDDAEVEKAVKTVVKQLQTQIDKSLTERGRQLAGLRQEAQKLIGTLQGIVADDKVEVKIKVQGSPVSAAPVATKHAAPPTPREPAESNGNVPPARQKILDSLAWLETVGISKADRVQLALFAGSRPTSGTYKNNLGALRSAQLLDYPEPNFVSLTDAGRAVSNAPEAPATVDDLHERLKEMLPPAKWKILEVLIPVYPGALSREDLVKEINAQGGKAEVTSGAFKNNLGSLRSLGVISYPQTNHVAARSVLFLQDES